MAAVDLKKSAKTLTAGDEIPIPISQSQSRRLIANPSFRSGKYRIIAELFAHVNCSLRLLLLRKRSPTVQNVFAQVKVMAQR
ncbi:hypothetical protein COP1_016050 [Malus domestica]